MDLERQKKLPFLDALKKYIKEGVAPFDVPGHHMGHVDNAHKELSDLMNKNYKDFHKLVEK